jgi:tight adherence protein B
VTTVELLLFLSGSFLVARHFLGRSLPAAWLSLRKKSEKNAMTLRQDFLFLDPGAIQWGTCLAGAIAYAVAARYGGGYAAPAAAAFAFAALPAFLVKKARARRKARLISQLPSLLQFLSSSLRAGQSFPQAILSAPPLLACGMKQEVEWLSSRYRVGTPMVDILKEWEDREEFRMILRPLCSALRSGGNVSLLLERGKEILVARKRASERMASLTAQARLQALVLSLLPPAILYLLLHVDPLLAKRLTETNLGKLILAASLILQVTGWIMVRAICGVRR